MEENGGNNGDSIMENSENIDDSNNITNIRKKIMEQSYKDKWYEKILNIIIRYLIYKYKYI